MPSGNSIWDLRALRATVTGWYGLVTMPMRIVSREDEIDEIEREHIEIPVELWEYVNHPVRQVRMWAKHDWVDIVVWNKSSQSFRMIQDIRFKDAYATETEWHTAVLEVLKDKEVSVWFVFHE
jgi:hypothetical protein